ncbi:tyrosine-type recombinase/integrase [Paraburkholderia podalyriae]|uniref:tyrosine-type recombinase/integrase n=1 Tax=Paraburkholderia TaxID=1822464 RepID=UPI0035E41D71
MLRFRCTPSSSTLTSRRTTVPLSTCLDDIDWADGVIHIRGAKSRRDRDLPLFRDVGRALLAYVKGERPSSSQRAIFLQAIPPRGPLSDSSAVSKIVRRALSRAGLYPSRGAAPIS